MCEITTPLTGKPFLSSFLTAQILRQTILSSSLASFEIIEQFEEEEKCPDIYDRTFLSLDEQWIRFQFNFAFLGRNEFNCKLTWLFWRWIKIHFSLPFLTSNELKCDLTWLFWHGINKIRLVNTEHSSILPSQRPPFDLASGSILKKNLGFIFWNLYLNALNVFLDNWICSRG